MQGGNGPRRTNKNPAWDESSRIKCGEYDPCLVKLLNSIMHSIRKRIPLEFRNQKEPKCKDDSL